MYEHSGAGVRTLLQWSGAIIFATTAVIILLMMAAPPQAQIDGLSNPLAPPQTDSPRATFSSFHREIEEVERLVRETYKQHVSEPGWFQSAAVTAKLDVIRFHLDRAVRCLDLSETPPSNRDRVAIETAMLLEEIFDRVGVPPLENIPDHSAMKALAAAGERTSWTVPNTEIRIARVESGPRAGEFLFTADSVGRAYDDYRKVRAVPSFDGFDFYSFYALSPGDWMPPKWYAVIERLPPWFHQVLIDNAHWQWLAMGLTILLAFGASLATHGLTRPHGLLGRSVPHWALPVVLPGTLLLIVWCTKAFVDFLNFTGPVQRMLATIFEIIVYLCFTWFVVSCSFALSDHAARAWGARRRSFDSGVLRVGIRLVGILLAAGLLAYGASQIGVPLVGILAGLGVGGLAVALAAQPTIENFIGGIMIYADRPVRVGDHCKFGDMAGVIEEIGIRSTRIRAADRSIISIPNGEFSKLRLTNYSRRDQMLFNATLGLGYQAKGDQISKVLQKLREMLSAHPNVDPQSAKVHLTAFGPSAMEVEISAGLRNAERPELSAVREELLLRMSGIVEAEGVQMTGR